ncbi:MAG: diaminopimelate decarboxylase [Halopenitus sp.]
MSDQPNETASTAAEGDNPAVRRLGDWDADRLRDLASEHDTPLYVVDLDRVRENCARLRDAFPAADVRYAVKAHTGQAVLETVREAGLDAECASAGELDRVLEAGFPGERVHYTAVNPPARDLDYAVSAWNEEPGLTITVGVADTLDRLAERGYDGRVCVRVNPGVGAGHHEKVRTGADVKFGVPYDRAADLVREADERFDVVGIHAHAGSGIDAGQLESHRELVSRMGDLARSLATPDDSDTPAIDLEYVDVGGGFGVPYEADEPPLDLQDVAEATRSALGPVPRADAAADVADDDGVRQEATLAVEPGRYVVADAGVLLTRINTTKPTAEETVVGVDAGMTDLLRPAMYDAFHPIRNLSGAGRRETPVTVAGPICESADVFSTKRPLARPERGDVLAIGIAGAYGYEMASQYNSRPRPAEVAIEDDDARVVRRRETLADLTEVER